MLELNKVYNEDCIGEKGMCLIPDKSIDMILCDLPYGTTACKWDSVIPFETLWQQYERIIKNNGSIALFGSEPFSSYLRMSNIKLYKYDYYWKKTKAVGFQHSKNKPMKIIETISIFSKAPMGHISQLGDRRMEYNPQGVVPTKTKVVSEVWHGNMMGARPNQVGNEYMAYTNFPNDLLEFKQPIGKQSIHPTQKPVELCEWLIKTYTNENEIVLDNCMGSGTTAVACKNLNRNYIGFEIDSEYCKLIEKRLSET